MREGLGTATGRGLVAARTGDTIVLVATILFLLSGLRPWVLVVGVLAAGLPGLVSARRLWVGRFEFGPEHETAVRRAMYVFAVACVLLVLALLSFQTFPSSSLGLDLPGDNATGEESRIHRFKDLLPPVFMLGAAMLLEVLSSSLVLWNLVGHDWRRWVAGWAGAGATGGIVVVWQGWTMVQAFESQTGRYVDSLPAATYYYDRFLGILLGSVAVMLLVTRVGALLLLRRTLAKVREAEQDAESGTVTEPAPTP